MDKSSFIKLLKKEGFYVDDSKALPTVLCPPGDYNATIKAVKKIKVQAEYNESFSIKISNISAISAPLKSDSENMSGIDMDEQNEPSDVISEDAPEVVDKSVSVIPESSEQQPESDNAFSQSDFFSVFDTFD